MKKRAIRLIPLVFIIYFFVSFTISNAEILNKKVAFPPVQISLSSINFDGKLKYIGSDIYWSPDENYLLFSAFGKNEYIGSLILYDIKNRTSEIVSESFTARSKAAWSHDSMYFIFNDSEKGVAIYRVNDKTKRYLHLPPEDSFYMSVQYDRFFISPNDELVAIKTMQKFKSWDDKQDAFTIQSIKEASNDAMDAPSSSDSISLLPDNINRGFFIPIWYSDSKKILVQIPNKDGEYYPYIIDSGKKEKLICKIGGKCSWEYSWQAADKELVLKLIDKSGAYYYGLLDLDKKTTIKIKEKKDESGVKTRLYDINSHKYLDIKDNYISVLDKSIKPLAKYRTAIKAENMSEFFILNDDSIIVSENLPNIKGSSNSYQKNIYLFDVRDKKAVKIAALSSKSLLSLSPKMKKIAFVENSSTVYIYNIR